MAETRCYREGALTDQAFSLDDVDEHLAHENALVWVDLCRPSPDELQIVAAALGLHSLAVENAALVASGPSSTVTDITTS